MSELRLRRDPDDRRRYGLDGVGQLRVGKWYRRGATIAAESGESWELSSGMRNQALTATDASGGVAATYQPRGALKRGGEIALAAGSETYPLWRGRRGGRGRRGSGELKRAAACVDFDLRARRS